MLFWGKAAALAAAVEGAAAAAAGAAAAVDMRAKKNRAADEGVGAPVALVPRSRLCTMLLLLLVGLLPRTSAARAGASSISGIRGRVVDVCLIVVVVGVAAAVAAAAAPRRRWS